MNREEFQAAVEEAYRRDTGAPSAHGARVWLARQLDVSERAVRHWWDGTRAVPRPVQAYLRTLK